MMSRQITTLIISMMTTTIILNVGVYDIALARTRTTKPQRPKTPLRLQQQLRGYAERTQELTDSERS